MTGTWIARITTPATTGVGTAGGVAGTWVAGIAGIIATATTEVGPAGGVTSPWVAWIGVRPLAGCDLLQRGLDQPVSVVGET
jgi:hypothetical protein